jgi:hypothetical protein
VPADLNLHTLTHQSPCKQICNHRTHKVLQSSQTRCLSLLVISKFKHVARENQTCIASCSCQHPTHARHLRLTACATGCLQNILLIMVLSHVTHPASPHRVRCEIRYARWGQISKMILLKKALIGNLGYIS